MMRDSLSRISFFLTPLLFGMQAYQAHAHYQVKPGDTLSGLALSRYGNTERWKEIWEANKANILNPNLIFPGQRLTLLGNEPLNLVASNATTPIAKIGKHSQEWRLLPLQNWEKFVFKTSPEVDPDGFDRRSRVAVRVADKTDADQTIASDRIPISGDIVGARSDYDRVFLGEQVFIRSDEALQVGSTYSVTPGPEKVVSERDGRVGFTYDISGKIRIIGVRDGLFIGTITAIYNQIVRHQLLIPEVGRYDFVKAIAAPSAIPANIIVNEAASQSMLSEQRVIFLDVGTEDGVKTGMIFRQFLHKDPNSGDNISTRDFMIESEIQVLQAKEKFSVAIILNSRSHLKNGDEVVALTDLADLHKNQGLQTILQDKAASNNVDELDKMDTTEGLGEKENQELRQLEKWSNPTPSDSGTPLTDPNEIQKIDVHGEGKKPIEIGKEPAPNDGSDKNTKAAPESTPPLAPETAAPTEPAPEATPAPVPESPIEASPTPAPVSPTPAPATPTPSAAPAESQPPPAAPSIDPTLDDPAPSNK